jgi:CrcB protein
MQKVLLIALAGACGTLARYGLAGLVQVKTGSAFPFGTLAVNLIGCFFFGVVASLAERYTAISGETRMILLTGFAGAFTTFSTLMYETNALRLDGQWLLVGANVALQLVGGLICIVLGLALGRMI